MGNPELKFMPMNDRIAPPFAPPLQPGEVRTCAGCVRLIELVWCDKGGRHVALCPWMGEHDDPFKGCSRWGATETPVVSVVPHLLPPERVYKMDGKGTKRNWRARRR